MNGSKWPLQEWYVGIAGTGFHSEHLVFYVHKPSLLSVIVKGKTVQETYEAFLERLEKLLIRFSFPQVFISTTMLNGENYIVSNQGDSQMISQVNQFSKLIAYSCSKSRTYEEVNIDAMEDKLMRNIYQYNSSKTYPPPLLYWEEKLGFKAERVQINSKNCENGTGT